MHMTRSLALALLAALFAARAVPAADCSNPRKPAGAMSESVYHAVETATRLIAQKQYDEAIDKLMKMSDSGSDYEKAVVWYNLGFAYNARNDAAGAAKAFAQALALNALPQAQHEQLQLNLGQLYIVSGQVDEGIRTLQSYITQSCSPVPAEAHLFLANALGERKRYREALPQIDLALSKAKAPKESWVQLKLAMSFELQDYPACAQTLVQLIALAPAKPDYWKQLSTIFYQLKQNSEAVAVLTLADRQGLIDKPNEKRNLYNIYMMLDLPFKAGMLLQQAIDKGSVPADEKTLEALANAWINARESDRAEAVLKRLASVSERGDYLFKLGAMYGDDERWKESREMLAKALDKGGLKRPGEAWMRLAVADYNLKDMAAAQASLHKALTFDESRKQASEWLRHLGGRT